MKHICLLLTVVIVFVSSTSTAFAGPGKLVPFISLKQEYSDNITFNEDDEQEDYITTSTAGAELSFNSERVNAKIDGQVFHLSYWDNDGLDATNGSAKTAVNYKATERVGVGATASYKKDSRRDADTDTTGLILSGDTEQADFSLSSSVQFSETSTGQTTIAYGMVETDGGDNQNEDNDSFSVDLAFSKDMSKMFRNTTWLLNFSYLNYTSEEMTISVDSIYQDVESNVFQLYTGFSKDITELYSIFLQAGVSFTDTTEGQRINNISLPDQDSSTWGGVLLSGLNYNGLYWDFGLSLSHDMRGSSNSNGTVERSSLSLEVDRQISEDFSLLFNASCYLNKNERLTQSDLEDLTINIQPSFQYKFLDTFILSGIFRHTTVEDRQNDTSSERNLIYLMIRKNFDLQ